MAILHITQGRMTNTVFVRQGREPSRERLDFLLSAGIAEVASVDDDVARWQARHVGPAVQRVGVWGEAW